MTATQPVPGFGPDSSMVLLIGEAPGREEDEAGVPFVGRAGQRLDRLMKLGGLDMNEIYLSNVCRCRPPANRTPKKKEIQACKKFLLREIELLKPKKVITLGSTPLGIFSESGIMGMHGTGFEAEVGDHKFQVVAQLHPAAALHQPRLWSDMLQDWEFMPSKVPCDFQVLPESELWKEIPEIISLDTETDGKGGLGRWSIAFRSKIDGGLKVISFYGPRPGIRWPCPVVFHNAKYDLRELRANRMALPEKYEDTFIAAYCLGLGKQAPHDEGKRKSGSDMVGGLGLKYLMRRQLGMTQNTWKEVADHPELQQEYNARDSIGTLLLWEKWKDILPAHYREIDMPLLDVLMAMEDRGIQIDPEFLLEYGKVLDANLANYDLPLNPFAIEEVQSYVYGTLGIEPWKFTDAGAPSVEEEVLEQLHDPVLDKCIEYKHLYKDRKTYVENYMQMADVNHRIHPEFKQTSTTTRRLSCSKPNLQNVFKRDDRVKLRGLFRAKKGHKIIRMDYNQLDFRCLGVILQDPRMVETFRSGKKIHTMTSEEMGINYDDAKIANFSVMFKVEAWSLSQQMKKTIDEARDFMARYFSKFPKIKAWHEEMERLIKTERKVTIPFENAVRRIDAMYVDNWKVQQEAIREGTNIPVQGLESWVVKRAMIDLHFKHHAPIVLQVHDELLFEIPEEDALRYAKWLKEYVPNIIGELNGIRFEVEVGIGDNWYTAGLKENAV